MLWQARKIVSKVCLKKDAKSLKPMKNMENFQVLNLKKTKKKLSLPKKPFCEFFIDQTHTNPQLLAPNFASFQVAFSL